MHQQRCPSWLKIRPSNLIIKRLKPARYLAGLVFFWGLVATFTAFCNNFAALVACRLLLGVFEAGLFPGVILYLSMFYNKRNVSLRNACFYGTSAIAGALGGLVAYAIGELDGAAGWRWVKNENIREYSSDSWPGVGDGSFSSMEFPRS